MTEYDGRTQRAVEFKNRTLWMEFGRPSTPWPDDASPPSPTPGETDVDIPYLYVKVADKSICRPCTEQEYEAADPDDRASVGSLQYLKVADEDAYDESARCVYCRAVVGSWDHPAGMFRQARLYSDLVPQAGYENSTWLLPENVTDPGIRQWFDTFPRVTVAVGIQAAVQLILEME